MSATGICWSPVLGEGTVTGALTGLPSWALVSSPVKTALRAAHRVLSYAGHSKSLLHVSSGAAAAIPAFTNETAEASEGRRAGKETAGHMSPQGSAPWSLLSRHLPPCTADRGFHTDLAACGTQATRTT